MADQSISTGVQEQIKYHCFKHTGLLSVGICVNE